MLHCTTSRMVYVLCVWRMLKNSNYYEKSKNFVPYSLVLKESHVSLIPHMTLISRPKTLTIDRAISLLDHAKNVETNCALKTTRLYGHDSLGSIPWPSVESWLSLGPNIQLKCAAITLFLHMPLIQHQRIRTKLGIMIFSFVTSFF